jgi:excisionase family DNA binding protein
VTAPALLTEAEAAEALRLCARTLRKARHEGLLPYVRIGRTVRYTPEDLQAFLAANRRIDTPCPDPSKTAARRITNTTSKSGSSGFMAQRAARLSAKRSSSSTA